MITTGQAIMSLRPGAEWAMSDNNVDGIVWLTEGVEPLTQAEVDAEITRLEAAAMQAEADRVADIQEAQAELKTMGLSDKAIATISGYSYPYSPAV